MGIRRLLALLLLLPSLCFAGDWSREDTYRQSALTGLLIADWAQTRYIAKHSNTFYETNTVLGKYPSVGRVDNYFALSIVAHAAISTVLPNAWRQGWQYVWIGIELEKVAHNHSIGVRMNF